MEKAEESFASYKEETADDRGKRAPTRQMILLVKECPMLWDRQHGLYRDKAAKESAWQHIVSQLVPNYEEMSTTERHEAGLQVVKKWNNVRDAYKKFRKNSSNSKRKPYLYADILSFLDSTYSDDVIEACYEDNEGEDSYCQSHEIYLDMEESVSEETKPKRLKLSNSQNNETAEYRTNVTEDENIIAILARIVHKQEDEDTAFFNSITPTVKSLRESTKMDFKIKVLNLLKELKERDSKERTSRTRLTRKDSDSE